MINSFDGPYAFLSNFFPCDVVYDRIHWATVEHAYQAQKTFDIQARIRILLQCENPSQAKALGLSVQLRPGWNNIKVHVMRELIRSKFCTGGMLADELVRTYPHELIEGNTWRDSFWGVYKGIGENWLGKLLMERRKELMILGSRIEVTCEAIEDVSGVSDAESVFSTDYGDECR